MWRRKGEDEGYFVRQIKNYYHSGFMKLLFHRSQVAPSLDQYTNSEEAITKL